MCASLGSLRGCLNGAHRSPGYRVDDRGPGPGRGFGRAVAAWRTARDEHDAFPAEQVDEFRASPVGWAEGGCGEDEVDGWSAFATWVGGVGQADVVSLLGETCPLAPPGGASKTKPEVGKDRRRDRGPTEMGGGRSAGRRPGWLICRSFHSGARHGDGRTSLHRGMGACFPRCGVPRCGL